MKTTVIIINYNGIAYIKDCLESVLKSDADINVIVADNGSTDGSKELIESNYSSVKLLDLKNNTGFCYANNAAMKLVDTDYVMLLNNDTVIEPNAISLLEKVLDERSDAFSVQAKMVKMSDSGIIDSAGDLYCALGWAFAIGKDKPADKYQGIHKIFSSCGGACLIRKKILDDIGFLDENHFAYLEDVDLGYRALIHGYNSYINNEAVVHHVGSGSSGSRHNEFKVTLSSRNSIYILYKNMPLLQLIINLPLLLAGFLVKTLFFIKKGFGKTYIKGLGEGIKMSIADSKKNKVPFEFKRLGRYIYIEVFLLINIVRRIFG